MKKEIRIIIADDNTAFRKNIREIIESDENISIIGEAENGKAAAELIEKLKPDIAVLDVEMPEMTGLDVLRAMKNRADAPYFILLTMYKEEDMFHEAMDLGIKGYVLKESLTDDINECIKKVYENNYYISPLISNYLVNRTNTSKKVNKDLEAAHKLQLSLMPESFPEITGFSISAHCTPCMHVGGDWYDYIEMPDGKTGLILADISGKGLEAALLMSSARSIVRLIAENETSPGKILTKVNKNLVKEFPSGKFVTMIFAVIDNASGNVVLANAGHPYPVYVKNGGAEINEMENGFPLGIMETEYKDTEFKLNAGDRLVFYSDGATDAENETGEQFNENRLAESSAKAGADASVLYNMIHNFSSKQRTVDDITILIINKN